MTRKSIFPDFTNENFSCTQDAYNHVNRDISELKDSLRPDFFIRQQDILVRMGKGVFKL